MLDSILGNPNICLDRHFSTSDLDDTLSDGSITMASDFDLQKIYAKHINSGLVIAYMSWMRQHFAQLILKAV